MLSSQSWNTVEFQWDTSEVRRPHRNRHHSDGQTGAVPKSRRRRPGPRVQEELWAGQVWCALGQVPLGLAVAAARPAGDDPHLHDVQTEPVLPAGLLQHVPSEGLSDVADTARVRAARAQGKPGQVLFPAGNPCHEFLQLGEPVSLKLQFETASFSPVSLLFFPNFPVSWKEFESTLIAPRLV